MAARGACYKGKGSQAKTQGYHSSAKIDQCLNEGCYAAHNDTFVMMKQCGKRYALLGLLALAPLWLIGQDLHWAGRQDSTVLDIKELPSWQPSDSLWQALQKPLPYRPEGERLFRVLSMANATEDTLNLGLLTPVNDFTIVYTPQKGWQYTGVGVPLEQRGYLDYAFGLPITLLPGETVRLRLATGAYDPGQVLSFRFSVVDQAYFQRFILEETERRRNSLALHFLFVGAVSIMMLYVFLLFLQNRRQSMYLYYGLYLLSLLLYLGPKLDPTRMAPDFFPQNFQLFAYTNEPVQWMLFVFYVLFVSHFLDLRSRSRRHFRLLRFMAVLYGLYGLFTLVYILLTGETTLVHQLFVPSHLVAFAFSLYLIVDFWLRLKSGLRYYIIAGSLFFVAGAMVSMYYSLFLYAPGETDIQTVPFQLGPIDFMKLGVLAEVLCFALGIGHRIRITYRQKAHAQRAYIQELKRNDALNRQIQQDLTEQVEKRSQEIVDKTRELEQERSARIKASLEQQLTRSQMTNLRLQMNPHFIFNALNSIRHLVLKKDFRTASAHIGDFARLLRLILQNTSQTNISLQDELDTLGLYLGFEQRRFGERLDYEIIVGKGLNPDNVQIPPMLIQPFVENAVWHGLMHKKEPGKIWIKLNRDKDQLHVQVRDNGIGRQKSQEIGEKRAGTEKSYGLSITKDRLALMERLKQGKGQFEVKDLVKENGEPAGTQVDMCIPL